MPLLIQEEFWDQTDTEVVVVLPLKNVSRKSVDIVTSSQYVKVSYPPYLFETSLFADIDDKESSAEITQNQVFLKLRKAHSAHWGSLQNPRQNDKEFMRYARNQALDYVTKQAEDAVDKKLLKNRESQSFAVGEHIQLESQRKSRIKCLQAEEKLSFFNETVPADAPHENEVLQQVPRSSSPVERSDEICAGDSSDEALAELLENLALASKMKTGSRKETTLSGEGDHAKLPGVRNIGNIKFDMTPRIFPTPKRESQTAEELEWLARQTSYKKIMAGCDGTNQLSPEERDPLLLKRKGDGYAEVGDYESATVCYNLAVSRDCKMPEIYLNRGVCHFRKGNYHKTLEDTSRALENLNPPVEANRQHRLYGYWRRGIAFCRLNLLEQALVELEGAMKLDPTREILKIQVERVRETVAKSEQEEAELHNLDLADMLKLF